MTEPICGHVRELAAELSLGVLPGDQRAAVLAHLTRCPDCRRHVQELTVISDGLLGLVPGVEPPVGFEDRVLARLGMTGRANRWGQRERRERMVQPERHRRPARTPRWLPLAVAAAVVAALFGVGGWMLGHVTQSPPAASAVRDGDSDLLTATLVSTGRQRQIGQAYSYTGQPSWVYVVVETDDGTRQVSCELELRDGGSVSVGSFALDNGYGHWGAPDPVDPSTIVGARLLRPDGTVLATARF